MSSNFNELTPGAKSNIKLGFLIAKIITAVMGIGILLLGILFLNITDSSDKEYGTLSTSGNKSIAKVKDIQYERSTSRNGSKNRSVKTTYEIKTLSYNVDGKQYTIRDKDRQEKIHAKKGDAQTVFYEKSNPNNAVLERQKGEDVGSGVFPIIFIAFGGFLILVSGIAFFARKIFKISVVQN